MSSREITGFFMAASESAGLLLIVFAVADVSCEKWLGWFAACPIDFWVALTVILAVGLLLAWLLWLVFHRTGIKKM